MKDSLFLVEAYDDQGELIQKDESLIVKERLLSLVRDGKRIRREKRLALGNDDTMINNYPVVAVEDGMESYDVADEDAELEELFLWNDSDLDIYGEDSDDEYGKPVDLNEKQKFWSSVGLRAVDSKTHECHEKW